MEGKAKQQIGVILGSRPATPVDFYIAVDRDKTVQLDDAVFTRAELNINGKETPVLFYGIVQSVERSYEGLEFDTDMYYLNSVPVEERFIAYVRVTMIEPEYLTPPRPGSPVFLAKGEKFQKTIGAEKMSRKIPAGLSLTTDEKIYIDLDFIDGKKGAHVNISGISGIATKTSYGIFLLHEIMRYSEKEKQPYTGIVFNVKGEDLLFMDEPNKKIYKSELNNQHIEEWRKFSEEVYKEFIEKRQGLTKLKVKFFAPPKKTSNNIVADVNQREMTKTSVFGWTAWSFGKLGIIKYAISEDDSENVKALIEDIEEILKILADYTADKMNDRKGIVNPFDSNNKIEKYEDIKKFVENLFSEKPPYIEAIKNRVKDIRDKYSTSTKKACFNRIHRISKIANFIGPEFSGDSGANKIVNLGDLKMENGVINVFHIGSLDEISQRIVVGSILSEIFEQQSREGGGSRKAIIFLDELSKYAPREGHSPIKEILEDIAERGRSLGVILIGAQQSARTVSRKIIMNSAVKIVGRMSSEEIESTEYGFLTRELKMRLLVAQPGRLVINQPGVYTPIMVKFPFPFWATRKEEAYEDKEEKENEIREMLNSTYG
ncbi:MAG: ATP-binding protein [bacterium]|nr:ATP-binding protein [bacterium]